MNGVQERRTVAFAVADRSKDVRMIREVDMEKFAENLDERFQRRAAVIDGLVRGQRIDQLHQIAHLIRPLQAALAFIRTL